MERRRLGDSRAWNLTKHIQEGQDALQPASTQARGQSRGEFSLDEIARDGTRHNVAIRATRLCAPAMFGRDGGKRPLDGRSRQAVVAIRKRLCVQAQPAVVRLPGLSLRYWWRDTVPAIRLRHNRAAHCGFSHTMA